MSGAMAGNSNNKLCKKGNKRINMKHKPRFLIQCKIYTHLLQKQCICVAYDYMSKCIV